MSAVVPFDRTWHYQDKRAAEHRAEVCREGRFAVPEDHVSPGRDAIPAADSVSIERSDPITWPEAVS